MDQNMESASETTGSLCFFFFCSFVAVVQRFQRPETLDRDCLVWLVWAQGLEVELS